MRSEKEIADTLALREQRTFERRQRESGESQAPAAKSAPAKKAATKKR